MAFKLKRQIVSPRTSYNNLDPIVGAGSFGALLATRTWLRPIYLPAPAVAIGFVYQDAGVGVRDFGVYQQDLTAGALVFRRIVSTGSFAGTNTNTPIKRPFAAPILLNAGKLFIAESHNATGNTPRTVNVWPGYSVAGVPPLPATLTPAVDDSSNFPQNSNLYFE